MNEELVREIAQKSNEELSVILENYTNFDEVIILVVCLELDKRRVLDAQYFPLRDALVDKYFQQPQIRQERKKINSWQQLFIPNKLFAITQIIVLINVLVYLVMVIAGVHFFSPTAPDLLAWGGSTAFLSLSTEPWRLLTAMFLHGGILHLFFNMYALLYVGTFLENLVGKTRYIVTYLLAGIFASLFSLFFKIPEYAGTVGVGASGAIFGMFGLFIVFLLTDRKMMQKQVRNQMLQSMGFFLVINLVVLGSYPGIDNTAHIGGLVFGVVAGLLFFLVKMKTSILNSVFISVSVVGMAFFYNFLGQKVLSYDNLERLEEKEENINELQEEVNEIIGELQEEWDTQGYDKNRIEIYKKQLDKVSKLLQKIDANIEPEKVHNSYRKQMKISKEYFGFWLKSIKDLESNLDNKKAFEEAHKRLQEGSSKWNQRLKELNE